MTPVTAILAYLNGVEAHRNRAAAQLYGSPYHMRLFYLRGHPGIWESELFWAGRIGDRFRLVDEYGERCYDMEVSRIRGVTCSQDGHLFVRYEPTPGLVTSIEFRVESGGTDSYRKLLQLLSLSA